MQAQRTEWVDAIRYLRGLGPPRRRRIEAHFYMAALGALAFLTLFAVLNEFG